MSELLALRGAPGSPYTRKMLAVLRYRQIPYQLILGTGLLDGKSELPQAKVQLAPTFYFRDEKGEYEAIVDSTPIIRRLENEYAGRSVIPNEPITRFLDYLLEDFADEWLTKAMFHYRWYYGADIKKAGEILPRWTNLTATEEDMESMSEFVRDRQINRLYVVGSNDTTAPVIEESYQRILRLMASHMNTSPYMFGHRPAASDFGLYGQLTQLAVFDPTPMKIADEIASRVVAWVGTVDDLSGHSSLEDQWNSFAQLGDSLKNIFREVGKVYVPALLANAEAVESGAQTVKTEIDGKEWVQEPFPYQAKCLQWLRQEFVRLEDNERKLVLDFLDGTGCHSLFQK